MKEELNNLLTALKVGSSQFKDVLEFIEKDYQHQPTAFKNGEAYNESTQNQGSVKVFAFAKINGLTADETLCLFAEHYKSVLDNPAATDHQNIRQFIAQGWEGIAFEGEALIKKH